MANGGYRYHVFLSYKRGRRENGRLRDDDVETWVRDFLEPELQRKLSNALEEPAEVFCDKFEIRTGDDWRRTLVDALRSSFCVVPVWSSLYFQSRWCVSEWGTFRQRAKGLVLPITWQHPITLPPAAGGVEYKDFSAYTYTSESFRKSERYLEFEDLVKVFARDVARAVNRAPQHQAGWDVIIPDTLPNGGNVVQLDDVPDRDAMLVQQRSRVRRGNISLAA